MSGDLTTTGRMKEKRIETSDGEKYERLFETRTTDGSFRPTQKVESEKREYSNGSSRTHTVESTVDLNGNASPSREILERQFTTIWGRETIERIIRKIESGGNKKLERVEQEEHNPKATSGVVTQKVIKQPDAFYGLRETQKITTSIENQWAGPSYKKTVTEEYPRNSRFGSPVVTQVQTEKVVHQNDGTTYIETETKIRDVNGDLKTISVTRTDSQGNER